MFIKLTLKSKNMITNIERRRYIGKFFGGWATYTNEKRKQGFITKFNNSIGFKDVESQMDNHNIVISAKVDSPEGYMSPEQMLYNALTTSFKNNEIAYFLMEMTQIEHTFSQYSYKTQDILFKFQKFLNKIFPDTISVIEYFDDIEKLSLKDFVESEFFMQIDESTPYTIEACSYKMLNKDEIQEIIKTLNTIYPGELNIKQSFYEEINILSEGKISYLIELEYL